MLETLQDLWNLEIMDYIPLILLQKPGRILGGALGLTQCWRKYVSAIHLFSHYLIFRFLFFLLIFL